MLEAKLQQAGLLKKLLDGMSFWEVTFGASRRAPSRHHPTTRDLMRVALPPTTVNNIRPVTREDEDALYHT